jgi:hypothetical protein
MKVGVSEESTCLLVSCPLLKLKNAVVCSMTKFTLHQSIHVS